MLEEIRPLPDLAQALRCFDDLRSNCKPATLSPAYVQADARRNSCLETVFLSYRSQGECWLHSLHLCAVPGMPWRDASSPYGYGGPLSSSTDPIFLAQAWAAYGRWMTAQKVAVEYLRFHPLTDNHAQYQGSVADNRSVVSLSLDAAPETSDQAPYATSYAARLRGTLRKAERLGLVAEFLPLAGNAAAFAAFYRSAMQAMGTDAFYWFEDAYFDALAASGLARLSICRAAQSADWLAAALILDGAGVSEYHLAASSSAGRSLGAGALALHAGVQLARQGGQKTFYFGGGTNAQADNPLLFFKAGFSPERRLYRTGTQVFDRAAYAQIQQAFPAQWDAHPEWPIFYRIV